MRYDTDEETLKIILQKLYNGIKNTNINIHLYLYCKMYINVYSYLQEYGYSNTESIYVMSILSKVQTELGDYANDATCRMHPNFNEDIFLMYSKLTKIMSKKWAEIEKFQESQKAA
jgi:hypothetical protein